jgi:hypothetical protein
LKPPKNTKPSELWQAIISSPQPSDVVDYPRLDSDGHSIGKLRIKVLPMDEHDQARLRAQRWLRETRRMPKEDWDSDAVREVLSDAIARHLLSAACVEVDPIDRPADYDGPDRYARIFATPEDLGKIPANELAQLFRLYLMVQHKYGGIEARIETDEEVEAWISALVEGGSEYPLARCSLEALSELCFRMALRLAKESHSDDSPNGSDVTSESSDPSTYSPGLPPPESVDDGPPLPMPDPIDDESFTIEQAIDIARLKRD